MTVVACTLALDGDAPSDEVGELLTFARNASAALDTDLRWLVLGPAPDWTAALRASRSAA